MSILRTKETPARSLKSNTLVIYPITPPAVRTGPDTQKRETVQTPVGTQLSTEFQLVRTSKCIYVWILLESLNANQWNVCGTFQVQRSNSEDVQDAHTTTNCNNRAQSFCL